jgi:hypothetical protein
MERFELLSSFKNVFTLTKYYEVGISEFPAYA